MIDLLIKNGTIVTHEAVYRGDIAVDGGIISSIGNLKSACSAKIEIDATGKLIMPGLIDPHVHIAHPFKEETAQDDFYSATVAAAHGGNTTIIDFAIQWDKSMVLSDCVDARIKIAAAQTVVDFALHACPTKSTEETVLQAPVVIKAGTPSFKVYMTYRKQGRMVDDAILFELLKKMGECDGLLGVHAENASISEYYEHLLSKSGRLSAEYFPQHKPNVVEAECINRAVFLNKWAKGKLYIFHTSTAEGAEIVESARRDGQKVHAETCTHYLTLCEDVYKGKDGANFICSPPLRSRRDIDALWSAINRGAISVISSDHCGFGKSQKALGNGEFDKTPNGLPGIECRLPLIYTEGVRGGRIGIQKLVEVLSSNAAKLFGLYPRKGALLPGSDADIVIVDTEKEIVLSTDTLHSPVDWTPYEGRVVRGLADTTIRRGEIIVQNGEFCGKRGTGRFLSRKRAGD